MNGDRRLDALTTGLVGDDPEVGRAATRAAHALTAWAEFPRFVRRAFGLEGRRLARRAAQAVLELIDEIEAAADRKQSNAGAVPAGTEGPGTRT